MTPDIEEKVQELKALLDDEGYRERLHPLEIMIAQSVVQEWRHLKCGHCARWIDALIAKMQGIEDYSYTPNTLVKGDDDDDEVEA